MVIRGSDGETNDGNWQALAWHGDLVDCRLEDFDEVKEHTIGIGQVLGVSV